MASTLILWPALSIDNGDGSFCDDVSRSGWTPFLHPPPAAGGEKERVFIGRLPRAAFADSLCPGL